MRSVFGFGTIIAAVAAESVFPAGWTDWKNPAEVDKPWIRRGRFDPKHTAPTRHKPKSVSGSVQDGIANDESLPHDIGDVQNDAPDDYVPAHNKNHNFGPAQARPPHVAPPRHVHFPIVKVTPRLFFTSLLGLFLFVIFAMFTIMPYLGCFLIGTRCELPCRGRVNWVDSLKCIAAVSILFCTYWKYLDTVSVYKDMITMVRITDIPFLSGAASRSYAVYLLFTACGIGIPARYFHTNDRDWLWRVCNGRFIRLVGPMIAVWLVVELFCLGFTQKTTVSPLQLISTNGIYKALAMEDTWFYGIWIQGYLLMAPFYIFLLDMILPSPFSSPRKRLFGLVVCLAGCCTHDLLFPFAAFTFGTGICEALIRTELPWLKKNLKNNNFGYLLSEMRGQILYYNPIFF